VIIVFVILFVVFAGLVGAPIVVAVLVSVASRREDRLWTLAGQAPGTIESIAHRVLGLHTRGIGWLQDARAHHARTRVPTGRDRTWERP
jgi:hypothetical protein